MNNSDESRHGVIKPSKISIFDQEVLKNIRHDLNHSWIRTYPTEKFFEKMHQPARSKQRLLALLLSNLKMKPLNCPEELIIPQKSSLLAGRCSPQCVMVMMRAVLAKQSRELPGYTSTLVLRVHSNQGRSISRYVFIAALAWWSNGNEVINNLSRDWKCASPLKNNW